MDIWRPRRIQGDPHLQKVLRRHEKSGGGFEAALAEVQNDYDLNHTDAHLAHLDNLQSAINAMFADMDAAFQGKTLAFGNDINVNPSRMLARFDAIFTLNQDLLLERHYHDADIATSAPRKWNRQRSPGIRVLRDDNQGRPYDVGRVQWTPDQPSVFGLTMGIQPYLKLHGSWNWWSNDGKQMLVLGGDKMSLIRRHPLLTWYQKQFEECLKKSQTRLMVIGYGFGDAHINKTIRDASDANSALWLFMVHPRGRVILPSDLERIRDCGVSTRSLSTTFSTDIAEHKKLMRFFDS